MDSKCMEIAALGRPLYPGMLYDCRGDSFIPGVTLWDEKALLDDLDVRQKPSTDFNFATSDTLSDRAKLLDISASLKASFLCGLVEVEGSAKFLRDNKSSAHQSRVTMKYSQTTKFEQLTMKELGHITYPKVFEQKTATHVVTAVQYGAQAFMVFDHTSAENENKQNVEGNLYAVVKKIPTISINGDAFLKMTEGEKKVAENVSVTFYGDFELEENPTTYKDAQDVYKKLPTLLKQQQNKGVPLTVWLYPLILLDSKAAKLVSEINSSLVGKAEKVLEELGDAERRCNDLLKNQMTDNFPDVKARLVKFQDVHSEYKIAFQKALVTVLPAIRGGTLEEKALGDILRIHSTSPFTADIMHEWLDYMMTELNILKSSVPEDLTVVTSLGSLNSILFDPNVDVVVCLSFTSLKYEDCYLAATEHFMIDEGFTKVEQINENVFSFKNARFWFSSPQISKRMKQNLSLFTAFSKASKYEKGLKFIIASISDSSNPGSSIRLYQHGSVMDPNFQPVSKPPKPVVETSDGKVTLKFSKSPTGKTVRFRVEYRTTPPTEPANDKGNVRDTSEAQTTLSLTELKLGEQYWVRYRAVSDVGVSEASDYVPFIFNGKLNKVTVGQSWNFSMPSLFNELRTEILTSMGISQRSLSTTTPVVVSSSLGVPYSGPIPGGLRAGVALFFQGVVASDCDRFSIDLQTGATHPDVAFHFNPRMDIVVLNSYKNGTWGYEECHGCPFIKGGAFDLIVAVKAKGYKVMVNGLKYCNFDHRIPVDKVTTLVILGGVCIKNFTIIKVNDVNLKLTYPANI